MAVNEVSGGCQCFVLFLQKGFNNADFAGEAKQLLGEHLKDIPYFALALYLNCGIWSNEKRFKKQSRIKAVSTADLISFLSGI